MVDNLNVIEGPFENINYCNECNWTPVKWRDAGVHSYIHYQRQQMYKVCPCCGAEVNSRVGRYVFPIIHTSWLRRFFIGPTPVKGWPRWKLEEAQAPTTT